MELSSLMAALLLGSAAQFAPLGAGPAQAVTPTPAPKPAAKPTAAKSTSSKSTAKPSSKTASTKDKDKKKAAAKPTAKPSAKAAAAAPAAAAASLPTPALSGAAGDVQQAVSFIEKGDSAQALAMADAMRDPAAQALIRWLALRVTARDVGFDRAAAIVRAHPTLPTPVVLRRRLEYLLFVENRDPQTILTFFAEQAPTPARARSPSPAPCSPPATRRPARPGCAMPGRRIRCPPIRNRPSWSSSVAC